MLSGSPVSISGPEPGPQNGTGCCGSVPAPAIAARFREWAVSRDGRAGETVPSLSFRKRSPADRMATRRCGAGRWVDVGAGDVQSEGSPAAAVRRAGERVGSLVPSVRSFFGPAKTSRPRGCPGGSPMPCCRPAHGSSATDDTWTAQYGPWFECRRVPPEGPFRAALGRGSRRPYWDGYQPVQLSGCKSVRIINHPSKLGSIHPVPAQALQPRRTGYSGTLGRPA